LKEEKRPSLNNTCGPERLYSIHSNSCKEPVQLKDLQAPTASVELKDLQAPTASVEL
jgi:hypothetical protein